jgi:hypothetical protein
MIASLQIANRADNLRPISGSVATLEAAGWRLVRVPAAITISATRGGRVPSPSRIR